jgi:hypothetical protein
MVIVFSFQEKHKQIYNILIASVEIDFLIMG